MTKEEIEAELVRCSNKEKEEWTRNIIRTSQPMYVVKTADLKRIAKVILNGNYLSYLETENFEHYENTIIFAKVLSKVKDFDLFTKYLYKYIPYIDNWASCDALDFDIKDAEMDRYYKLAQNLIFDTRTYARRIGVLMLFEFLKNNEYTIKSFELIKKLKGEQEYYVNMCVAWYLCEAFIKQRDMTLEFLQSNYVNNFVLAKTVSKCRDSFRVTKEDKEYLKNMKDKRLKSTI